MNFESTNMSRSIEAGLNQVNAIKIIEKKQGLGSLPDELRELAQLRLDNPDMGVWAKTLTKTVITIPCDQRYDTKDFDRIADVLTEYSKR